MEKQSRVLHHTHGIKGIKSSGVQLGYPYNRPRSYIFGYSKEKFVWVGADDAQSEFDHIFARAMQLSGDEYFYAEMPEVIEEYRRLASARGNALPKVFELNDALVLTKVLAPGAVDRFCEWQERKLQLQSLSGTFLADLDHHPDTRGPNGGPLFPTMPTHPLVYSYSQGRLHLGAEAFAVHGVHLYAQQCKEYPMCSFASALRRLTKRQQGFLVGNSLFCPLVGAWVYYCLSNLEPRQHPSPGHSLQDVKEELDDESSSAEDV